MDSLSKCINLMFALLLLQACASHQPLTSAPAPRPRLPLDMSLMGPLPEVAPSTEVLTLTPDQESDFLHYFHDEMQQQTPEHLRVYLYVQELLGEFTYFGQTLSASEAIRLKEGNCISLVLVTAALAKLVDIDIVFQHDTESQMYNKKNGMLFNSGHVRSYLYARKEKRKKQQLVLFRPRVKVDYLVEFGGYGGEYISEFELLSLYYLNLAADAMAVQQNRRAFALAARAYELSPDMPQAYNALALLYQRKGDMGAAGLVFSYADKWLEPNLALLMNYESLLSQSGNPSVLNTVQEKIRQLDNPDPYIWLSRGDTLAQQGHYARAIKAYHKALYLAPYLHEAHLGLAKVYYLGGRIHKAREQIALAIEWNHDKKSRPLYQAKLAHLDEASI